MPHTQFPHDGNGNRDNALLKLARTAVCIATLCSLPCAAQANDLHWNKVTMDASGGAYGGNATIGSNQYGAGVGFATAFGVGYKAGDNWSLGLQYRKYIDFTDAIFSDIGSIGCSGSNTCKLNWVTTNSYNLLFRQRPVRYFSYGVGLGWLQEDNNVNTGTYINGHFQSSGRQDLNAYRITLPYEMALNFGPAEKAGQTPWSIQVGIKGEVCSQLCAHGFYVGYQRGL